MTHAFQFDIEKLLSPISAEHPAGESLRYEGTYDKIRQARQEDDASLPQGVWITELRKAEWQTVESLCISALETRTKDLQIAAWLTEAWLNLHSFEGATAGIDLMSALCESFWDNLYPEIEGDDLDFRLAPLSWVNQRLSVTLRLRAVTEPDAEGEHSYCWADWENASRLDTMAHRPGAPKNALSGALTPAKFQQSVMLTPTAWFRMMRQNVRNLMVACASLEEIVDARAVGKSPGLLRFRAVAEAVATFVDSVFQQRNEPDESLHEDRNPITAAAGQSEAGILPIPSRIRDRADAYYLLAEAAEFLARTEPHSPTPYLIRRAIAWGGMSLEELLPELVRNGAELTEVFRLLQIGNKTK